MVSGYTTGICIFLCCSQLMIEDKLEESWIKHGSTSSRQCPLELFHDQMPKVDWPVQSNGNANVLVESCETMKSANLRSKDIGYTSEEEVPFFWEMSDIYLFG